MKKKYPKAFEEWFRENKNSDTLRDSYDSYKHDSKWDIGLLIGEPLLTFKQWAFGEWQED